MYSESKFIIPGVSASPVARNALIKRLGFYGFIECAELVTFLQIICNDEPGACELRYIRDKVQQCLDIHDNQNDYFSELRRVCEELTEKLASY